MRITGNFRTTPLLALLIVASTACGPKSRNTNNPLGPPNSNSNTQPTSENAEAPETPTQPSWKMQYLSKCPSIPNEKCLGSYGFSISQQGLYKVGPGPEGQSIHGYLKSDELKSLTTAIDLETTDLSETCLPDTGSTNELTIEVSSNNTIAKVHVTPSQFCYSGFKEDKAKNLKETFHQIAAKYYPTSFPNPCINVVHNFEKFYDGLKTCDQDSDCSYVDNKEFLPVDAWKSDKINVDHCSMIKPLLVAHGFRVVSQQLKLLTARELAERVCGPDFKRPSCDRSKNLEISKRPPVCHRGVCQLHPAVKMSSIF